MNVTDTLQREFNFNENDLCANQQGKLTREQKERLKERGTFIVSLGVMSSLSFAIMTLILGRLLLAATVIVASLIIILGGLVTWVYYKNWQKAMRSNKVEKLCGYIALEIKSSSRWSLWHKLYIQTSTFNLTEMQLLALENDQPYCIYYTKHGYKWTFFRREKCPNVTVVSIHTQNKDDIVA